MLFRSGEKKKKKVKRLSPEKRRIQEYKQQIKKEKIKIKENKKRKKTRLKTGVAFSTKIFKNRKNILKLFYAMIYLVTHWKKMDPEEFRKITQGE